MTPLFHLVSNSSSQKNEILTCEGSKFPKEGFYNKIMQPTDRWLQSWATKELKVEPLSTWTQAFFFFFKTYKNTVSLPTPFYFYLVFVVYQNLTFRLRNKFQGLGKEKSKPLGLTLLKVKMTENKTCICSSSGFVLTCCNFYLHRKDDKFCAVWSICLYSDEGCVIICFPGWKTGSHHSLGFIRRNFLTS